VDLPTPDSAELEALRLSYQARAFYRLLYEHRDTPMTAVEMREHLGLDMSQQEQIQRRRRELNRYFEIERTRRGRDTLYRLVALKPRLTGADAGISERDRAAVLKHGLCAMCGRSPLQDGVRLQVDHKIPKEWGGTDDLENLQPLCEECNRGKKNLFASYNEFADEIRAAIGHDKVHMRIGELLKAFDGKPVRSDLLDTVASPPGDYLEDWQKRLRELRVLGWEIGTSRKREEGRVRSYYTLVKSQPWPQGSIREEIRRLERERGY
jgi:5-methylcytosine-specific restriction endonuclease McrA